MNRLKLTDDRDRAEWLQCLAVAASVAGGGERRWEFVVEIAEQVYAYFLKRCGE